MSVGITPLHEAAHAVVAHLLGLPLASATVVKSGRNLGLVRFRDTAATFRDDPAKARALIVATLAGRAAVARVYTDAGYGCSEDDDAAWTLARGIVGDNPARAAEVALVFEEGWTEARELVADYSQAITDVARELDWRGTIKGDHLARCVEEAVERDRASPVQQRQRETRRKFWAWMEEHGQGGNASGSND